MVSTHSPNSRTGLNSDARSRYSPTSGKRFFTDDSESRSPQTTEDLVKASVDVPDDDDDPAFERVRPDGTFRFRMSWRKLWAFCGPGWLMSLAYLDPGNLEADLQQGAYTQYYLIWVLLWSTLIGLVLQEMAARLGVVTGRNLAEICSACYPRWVAMIVYVNMEVAIIGSDIQEVIGSAIALTLLTGMPLWAGCLLTGLDTFTFLAVHHLGVRYLEALITLMVSTMAVCFFINWGEVATPAAPVLAGLALPRMKGFMIMQAVGTVGAVIMPHNIYLHSGLVQSRVVDRDNEYKVLRARGRRVDDKVRRALCHAPRRRAQRVAVL